MNDSTALTVLDGRFPVAVTQPPVLFDQLAREWDGWLGDGDREAAVENSEGGAVVHGCFPLQLVRVPVAASFPAV